jgi:hypothetical protein
MTKLTLEAAAHVIQLALTPVLLLSATATLLNVFATRLARNRSLHCYFPTRVGYGGAVLRGTELEVFSCSMTFAMAASN